MTSTNYIIISGFAGALIGGGGADNPPSVGNVRFDGQEAIDRDYVKSDATLTATVLDLEGPISREASRLVIDGQTTYFSALTAPASYETVNGRLTYPLSLGNGSHNIQIVAYDLNNGSATFNRTVQVDTAGARAANAFICPNPYNPNQGNARIAYQLNQDSEITLYLFNELNQLVWKRVFAAAANGGKSGYNEILWDGNTDFSQLAPNGSYFLRIVSGGNTIGKIKVAILK